MGKILPLFAAAFVALSAPAAADADVDMRPAVSSARELPPYLQCVPYAREVSGIEIFGDAHTWWDQAEGRYQRGHTPKVGAVMAFRPHGNMTLGHVAAVSKVIDKRTVLLRHANWSPIDGRRGQIEDDVKAVDVSPENDWSEVRVWYAPLDGLGTTAWPVEGFIYSDRPAQAATRIAVQMPMKAEAKPNAREDVVAAIIAANS
jgi:surface antigen